MKKKDKNPIRVDTAVQKDMPSINNYFDSKIGETPGAESVIENMEKKGQLEAEKIIKEFEKNGIKTI
ncbi:hypothetical protein HNQ80_004097 [Anaerosolibacter carboniphilus]|uniref:Uncharacterized protein n=1 Tax=Anaerosolibacter carboniphilus TaxID=1417629 RepID=A0A841L1A3_9FIRM|nr:hypothetical protein [Anaerosolibacter carboniphilus]MBB6217960.1 hypothetical protein [Anaerosolibacter carboniphilus]